MKTTRRGLSTMKCIPPYTPLHTLLLSIAGMDEAPFSMALRCFVICPESLIIIHIQSTAYSLAYVYTTSACSDLQLL